MLENKFYKLLDLHQSEDDSYLFKVELNKDCDVYKGHFPGSPIAPGVCNIQMVRECVERVLSKKLRIDNIKQVKFISLVNPLDNTLYTISCKISVSDKIDVCANMNSDSSDCMTIKMSLVDL